MPVYTLTVNDEPHTIEADADTPLLWILRDTLDLTGTKFGCGEGVCSACTVHDSGTAVRSCLVPIAEAAGRSYTTIDGLDARVLEACRRAWLDLNVAECEYCQPGTIMAATAFLMKKPAPTDAEIDAAMPGIVCRCGRSGRMHDAIRQVARTLADR